MGGGGWGGNKFFSFSAVASLDYISLQARVRPGVGGGAVKANLIIFFARRAFGGWGQNKLKQK